MLNAEQNPHDLALRTKQFALRVIRVFEALPTRGTADVIGRQMLRSGTSVGAQYREARRARSTAEFISKVECVQQELDETTYWLELLVEAGIVQDHLLQPLLAEASELMAIFVASASTAKERVRKERAR